MDFDISKRLYKTKDRNFYLLLFIIVFCGLFLRFYDLGKHQSQNDEWLAAWHISEIKNRNFENYYQKKFINIISSENKNNFKYKLISHFKNNEEILVDIFKFNDFIKLSGGSTISPLMFYLGYFLISGEEVNYEKVISKLRKISIIYFLFCVYLFFLIFKKNNFFDQKLIFLLFLTIIVFSAENIIFSRQFFNYSYSIIIIPILILNLKRNCSKNFLLNYSSILFCIFTSYQTFFGLPAYFISKFYIVKKNNKNYSPLFFELFLVTVTVIIFYLVFLKNNTSSLGANWNSGLNNEFLFLFNNFKENYIYIISFLFKNSFVVIGNATSFFENDSIFFLPQNILFFLCFLIGAYIFFKSKNVKIEYKIFTFFLLGTFLFFVIVGMLTFSPTRHIIFYLPIIALLISFIFEKLLKNKKINFNFLVFSTILIIIISNSLFFLIKNRVELYDEDNFIKILEQNKIEKIIILNSCTSPLFFSKKIKENYSVISGMHGKCGELYNIGKPLDLNSTNIILVNFESKINKKMIDNKKLNLENYELKNSKSTLSIYRSEIYQNIGSFENQLNYRIYKLKN